MDTVVNKLGIPYVTHNAVLRCSFGLSTAPLIVTSPTRASIGFNMMATQIDCKPIANIPGFVMCSSIMNPQVLTATQAAYGILTPMPCTYQCAAGWKSGPTKTRSKNVMQKYIDITCTCTCKYGGVIHPVNSGQGVSVPKIGKCPPMDRNYKYEDTFWWASYIPVIGIPEAINQIARDLKQEHLLDAGLDILGLAGPFKLVGKGLSKVGKLKKVIEVIEPILDPKNPIKKGISETVQNIVYGESTKPLKDDTEFVSPELEEYMNMNDIEGDENDEGSFKYYAKIADEHKGECPPPDDDDSFGGEFTKYDDVVPYPDVDPDWAWPDLFFKS